MPRLGAHMSVAGGVPRAVERAVTHGCEALQIFTKNANQWRGRLLGDDEIHEFRSRLDDSGIGPAVSHASYLINLAATAPMLRQQSIDAMADEIDRAEALGLLGVVLHPGCSTHGDVEKGLALVAEALVGLFTARRRGKTMVLLEHTAGQGSALGSTFEQIAAILEHADGHRRLGVCLDTCHLLAAGYDITSPKGYGATFAEFERLVGFDRLRVFHMNDSKKPLGSHVDRHEHIGRGLVGLDAFRRIVNDPRFRDLPMLLETPKEEGPAKPTFQVDRFDDRNLRTLKGLVKRRR